MCICNFAAENMHILGFEPLINQRLLPPTFPRYTKIKPRNESLMYFEDVVNRLKFLNKIQTIASLHQALVTNYTLFKTHFYSNTNILRTSLLNSVKVVRVFCLDRHCNCCMLGVTL